VNAPRLQVPRWRAALGLLLAAVLALTPVRALLEASMLRHMLVQAPLLLLAGALLASAAGPGLRAALARWNALGISGLVAAGAVLGLLMVPRVLDLALAEPAVEAAKFALLLLAGAALALSWRPAGLLVQAFFLGNMLPMTAVAGQLYADSPVRVCNAYLLDDQARLGEWLIALACAAAVLWLAQVARSVVLREERTGRQDAIEKIA
jgi:hypothetical protein